MAYTKDDVLSVTLLSTDEYKVNRDIIPVVNSWWWLRSPGTYAKNAAYVFLDGEVYANGYHVFSDKAYIRPAYELKPEIANTLNIGDKVEIGKFTATVLNNKLCLLDDKVIAHRFDEFSNNWDMSEIKSFIESDEFSALVF